jgi:Zn-dependent protease with chaperone function
MSKVKRQQLGKMFETIPQETAEHSQERRADRTGRKATLFQIPEAAKKQLAILAIENDTTQQALLTDALNMLFSKHGKPPIA